MIDNETIKNENDKVLNKKYDLKLKQIFTILIIAGLFLVFAIYMLFMASDQEKYNMFITELKFSVSHDTSAFGSVYICVLFSIPIVIYMLELLIYKVKDVLILDNSGITYYAPEYKKVFIPKEKIEDIYITDRGQMKIKLKDCKIKKSIRAYFWTILKDIFLGGNPNNIYRINLNFIKCDIKEVREYLMQFNLDSGSSEAKKIVKDILQKYNYKNIEELKKDEKALLECVMKLYNMEKFTQVEIAAIMRISSSKVSKLIRKGL